jgi:GntR family transcriptional regulator/MocR family aminotransferase
MKELLIALKKGRQPKYRQLADSLRASIREGHLKPGDKLPSSRELAKAFEMNRHTVMNALSELIAEGWVEAVEKRHYQVVHTLPSTFLKSKSSIERKYVARQREFDFARSLRIGSYVHDKQFRYSFPSGFPDPRLFPIREFKSHLYDALHSKQTLLYGDPKGEQRLLDQVSIYLRRVRNITDRTLVITNGSQEALFLLSQLLIKPGDVVAVEALGYPPAFEAFRFAGAHLQPISIDKEGLIVEDLKKKIKHKKIRFLYITPLHQYPTTVTLSATRRLELYELAYKHNMLIIEDDYDHEFHYSGQPVAPLASFDPGSLVLYVSTFSKILFPSARLGFVAVPDKLGQELAKLKRISSRQNESILQNAIAFWMESGGFEKHLRRMRRAYEQRLISLTETLSEFKNRNHHISWDTPDGGMALWLDINRDSERIAKRAAEIGVRVYPESNYQVEKSIGNHLRIGFSGQTPEENEAGLKKLFSVFR